MSPHPVRPCLVLPCLTWSCLALPCYALLCRAVPCLALPCPALPCLALPFLSLPCLAWPCPALPCLAVHGVALPCLALPCPALPGLALPCLTLNFDTQNSDCFARQVTVFWFPVSAEEFPGSEQPVPTVRPFLWPPPVPQEPGCPLTLPGGAAQGSPGRTWNRVQGHQFWVVPTLCPHHSRFLTFSPTTPSIFLNFLE